MGVRKAREAARGFTMAEILIATGLATIVMATLVSLDAVRIRVTESLKSHMSILGNGTPDQTKAAQAAVHIARTLEVTDRFRIVAPPLPGHYWFRVPVGCFGAPPGSTCFKQTANYEWRSYRISGTSLRYNAATFDPVAASWGCSGWTTLASNIQSPNNLTFNQRNEDGDPIGVNDSNVIEYGLHWKSGTLDRYFRDEITLRQNGDWAPSQLFGLPGDQTIGIDATTANHPVLRGVPACLG